MPTTETNDPKALDKPKTSEEIKTFLNLRTAYDPAETLKQAEMAITNPRGYEKSIDDDDGEDEDEGEYKLTKEWTSKDDPVFRAMTLSEFKNGALMITVIGEQYRTFGIDMLKKLQAEYNCAATSEQATVELIVISFIRVLELQRRINNYINDQMSKLDILFFAILSKELDRANRQYSAALQTLRMLKQPSLNVNIKTNTAIVGQNQIIQENQNVNPI